MKRAHHRHGVAVTASASIALALGVGVAGCGGAGVRTPDAGRMPMIPGAQVMKRVLQCDKGSQAYCAVEMVIVAPKMHTSWNLVNAETRLLRRHRWTGENAINGNEHAAQSPGDKLRITYATAYADLQGIDMGWIERDHRITTALSDALFHQGATMSLMLEVGS